MMKVWLNGWRIETIQKVFKMSNLTPEQIKRQMYFRLTIFFLITMVIGFTLSDFNIHSQMYEKEGDQTVTDMRR